MGRRKKPITHVIYVVSGIGIGLLLAIGLGLIPLGAAGGSRGPDSAAVVSQEPEIIKVLQEPKEDSGGTSDFGYNPVNLATDRFTADERNNIQVYDERNQGVVNITTETVSYYWFFEAVPQEGSSGSGAIIDDEGYILTNNHVIKNAVKVYATLASGKRYEAEVVGIDPENDLAVIKIETDEPLTVIPLGSSEDLRVGQKVLAIGNPFSFERTLTTGVISGIGRPIRSQSGSIIQDMIQTDASINPGNSGGPLLDSSGRIIGVNTMIYSPSGGSIGVGFAVPIETAKRVIPDLIRYGRVQRGWIDITPIQLFPQLVSFANLPVTQGILISEVEPGGKAEAAGLRGGNPRNAVRSGNTIIYLGGDIIVRIEDTPITNMASVFEALQNTKPGDRVEVEYIRNGRSNTTEVELVLRPDRYLE